jgi:peptide/nickel transport system permease protein
MGDAVRRRISTVPGLTILVTVLGLNLLGDGLRDVLDPQTAVE